MAGHRIDRASSGQLENHESGTFLLCLSSSWKRLQVVASMKAIGAGTESSSCCKAVPGKSISSICTILYVYLSARLESGIPAEHMKLLWRKQRTAQIEQGATQPSYVRIEVVPSENVSSARDLLLRNVHAKNRSLSAHALDADPIAMCAWAAESSRRRYAASLADATGSGANRS